MQTENFKIYNIHEIMIQNLKKSFFPYLNKQAEKSLFPRTLSEARQVAGSATYKQVKQCEIVLSFKVSLFIQFIQS